MNEYNIGIVCVLLACFLASLSQVILKQATIKKYDKTYKEYLNFRVIFAYVIFFITMLMVMYGYKYIPLSLGIMLDCSTYIYIPLLGICFLGEKINFQKIIGIFFIVLGIFMYGLSL